MALPYTWPSANTSVLHTYKIHKPTLVGRPIISVRVGPTEKISAFVDRLIQPIAQQQATDFINFIERMKLPCSVILVSMDVTSLYTNIPQREGIITICNAYEFTKETLQSLPGI